MSALGDVTVTSISSDSPAVLPGQLVRLGELEILLAAQVPTFHVHSVDEVTGLYDYIQSGVEALVNPSSSVGWVGLAPYVICAPDGGLSLSGDGLKINLGQSGTEAAAGNHTHAQLHAPLTLGTSNSVTLSLTDQALTAEVVAVDNGGVQVTNSGIQVDSGVVSRIGHTHADLHKPVQVTDTNTIDLTIVNGASAQQISGDVRVDPTPGTGHAVIEVNAAGISVPLGLTSDVAASGDHTHAEVTTAQAGLMSASDKRKLDNYETTMQIEQVVSFFKSDALMEGDYIGGPVAFGSPMEIIGISGSFNAGNSVEDVQIGIEVNSVLVYAGISLLSIGDNARWTFALPAFYDRTLGSSLGIFVASGQPINIVCNSGVQTLPETAPYNIQLYLNVRSSLNTVPTYKVNCGGLAVSPFVEDASYTGGSSETESESTTIDLTGVTDPAPSSVYHSQRKVESTSYPGPIVYAFTGLAAFYDYAVRLHLCEYDTDVTHQAYFELRISGAEEDSTHVAVDIESAAGGTMKGLVYDINCKSSLSGTITIELDPIPNESLYYCASVCAIEIISA